MTEQEGVIKYDLRHQHQAISIDFSLAELNAWRKIMLQLELIGQNPARYQGYGFGNLSLRAGKSQRFYISGTQTGHLPKLTLHHLALIEQADPDHNTLKSSGLSKPSSEALTHAMLYRQNQCIQTVIHVHSPTIWRQTQALNIPCTQADVAYGTPAMAQAVEQLFDRHQLGTQGIISMLGHEDGIIAFADSLSHAAKILIDTLATAFSIEFDTASN
ncbi:class II aldolase/adducin family protein [methane-oxidizing endosymbiont of Gigantopelta aegis]|uniref:class II aldolase/adducin family protein n=1 Tax=methane-oxidizing endosymbiont of Gigantopelta aegis TaxID=2794938 RepID=UPI0018DBCAB4|nr:class II aldolase/adducin family protein [methane-oxidizing endosymbiont of Gigantopelta aegis]